MNIFEAKEILKNAEYLIENDNQDIPEKYSNDVYNNIYAEFSNKEEFQRFYTENKEKINDYTKFGWNMHLDEAKQILKKAGYIIESYAEDTQDPIAVLRKDITNGAISRFEHAQYDEYEQEPWVEEQNIKDIEFAEFLKVVMNAVGAKTQQELLDLAEDEKMFDKMIEAWFQYLLNEKNDCMGWDFTWGELWN